MNREIWKPIKGYEGLYEVSNLGRVRSFHPHRKVKYKILNPIEMNIGYYKVTLYSKLKKEQKYIHKLVAETFIPNPKNFNVINHINGNKKDNNVENLEWCTQKHNMEQAFNMGLVGNFQRGKLGKESQNRKIIKQIQLGTNKTLNMFYGACEAERQTNICCQNIRACCRGERKTAGGFIWQYEMEG